MCLIVHTSNIEVVRLDCNMKDSANYAAQNLGYDCLKQHQMDVVLALAAGRDVLLYFQQDMGKAYVMP